MFLLNTDKRKAKRTKHAKLMFHLTKKTEHIIDGFVYSLWRTRESLIEEIKTTEKNIIIPTYYGSGEEEFCLSYAVMIRLTTDGKLVIFRDLITYFGDIDDEVSTTKAIEIDGYLTDKLNGEYHGLPKDKIPYPTMEFVFEESNVAKPLNMSSLYMINDMYNIID